jgi:ribose transport system ATP-binding protein
MTEIQSTTADLPEAAADAAAAAPPGLELSGIVKTFPGVRALSAVNLSVLAGEVHALVGENGAGKSTLMAVGSGALAPDEGSVRIAGAPLRVAQPEEARRLGLAIVRQDPALLPDLTVAENMAIGAGRTTLAGLRAAPAWAQRALDPWQMGIDARSRVADLSVEQRFVVEIAKALVLEPTVLILDEPTEHLNKDEVERLFRRVRELAAAGTAVVYISHRIPEVKQIADRVTVLRDGQVRGVFHADAVTETQIVELVIGRALGAVFPPKGSATGAVRSEDRLVVRELTGRKFQDVSFRLRAGEVVGLAGVQGNGQEQLIRALAGLEPASGGVEIGGRRLTTGSGPAAAAAGVVYVPSDRHGEGVFLPMTVGENIVIRTLRRVSTLGFIQDRRIAEVSREQIDHRLIKTPSWRTPVSSLSGGNQQKVVFARTLLAEPRVLLAEEPTQGVDAGARVDIYQTVRAAADSGAAVLLLSSDGIELAGLCDRVLIMSRGRVIAQLEGDQVTEAEIAHAALTSIAVRDRDTGRSTRFGRVRSWLRGDYAPAAVLALVIALLALAIGARNSAYFSTFNVGNILFAASILVLVGAAQQTVVMGSGIDLSVGQLMSFLVVIASFFVVRDGNIALGIGLMVLAAFAVGLLNGTLVTRFGISPVVVTLAVALALQGVLFTLRDTPGGVFATEVTRHVMRRVGGVVPTVALFAVAVVVVLEWLLRRSRWGVELRAVGSRSDAAQRLGIDVGRTRRRSYLVTSLLVLPAAIVLMSQIGIGDGRPGMPFTLSSITVVVLAGASIFGGRGSYVGVLAAAVLLGQILGAATFLGLSGAWAYLLPGIITVGAAALYARLRRARSAQ